MRAVCLAVLLLSTLQSVSSVDSQTLVWEILSAACSASTEDIISYYSSVRNEFAPLQDWQFPITGELIAAHCTL